LTVVNDASQWLGWTCSVPDNCKQVSLVPIS